MERGHSAYSWNAVCDLLALDLDDQREQFPYFPLRQGPEMGHESLSYIKDQNKEDYSPGNLDFNILFIIDQIKAILESCETIFPRAQYRTDALKLNHYSLLI
jgi:hypothetical protein